MYTQKSHAQTAQDFSVQTDIGISSIEAETRLTTYGKNELEKEKVKSFAAMFLEQLNTPLIFVLILAAGISILLKEYSDACIVITVILLNSVIGVLQEGKAQKALEALKQMTSPLALAKRDGTIVEIPAALLVPGDIVILEAGRQVPADLRLTYARSLRIEEAALTGESVPVEKNPDFVADKPLSPGDAINMAFMSTNVINGRGEGIVIATGMNTQIGKIAHSISHTETQTTPLQKRLADLGRLLSILAIVLCILLFGIALIQKRNIPEMLITAISLAVAAVPEGLPAVVTIVLALSVSRMVNIHAIIRRLPSVETLGSVSIVCSDKTGTLTQNQMSVTTLFANQKLIDISQFSYVECPQLIDGFLLCNDAVYNPEGILGDPTEAALLGLAPASKKAALDSQISRFSEVPFDSTRKMMTTLHRNKSETISYTKGSLEAVLKCCNSFLADGRILPLNSAEKKTIEHAAAEMSSQALRVLALAMKKSPDKKNPEKDLTFIGLAGMIDPPREGVKESIALFKKASVKTAMITGDHVKTAFAIAARLGIASSPSECISGEELDALSDSELKERASSLSVFARVSPEHKVRIVKAFRSLDNIVAMTGDGVNDAPSLKTADIGIAMGKNGTDVAKNAADLILTDDNFSTIERAIEEGRSIYENIKKSILFLLSSNFGEIITMFLAILFGMPSPLKASHILWINLITDSLPALALGVDKNDIPMLMNKPPRSPKENLFAHGGLFCTLFYGALIAAISLIAFFTIPICSIIQADIAFTPNHIRQILSNQDVLLRSQTYAFTVLGFSQLFHAIGMRNVNLSIFRMNHRNNPFMLGAFATGLFLQMIVTEIPVLIGLFGTAKLSLHEWGALTLLSAVPLMFHELFVQISDIILLPHLKNRQQYQQKPAYPRKIQ